ncbi:DUF4189 domain-containing protein [Nocardia sp. NPDC051832]|uniref:DUF4189 domain-containing protein n=1 Tax=Nocardia sp. NPDC051832 TaxID=3155673 RepID=UPI00343773AE
MKKLRKALAASVIPAAGALIVAVSATAHADADLYGAIAASVGGYNFATAIDYPTQTTADFAAIRACLSVDSNSICVPQLQLRNECGAVVERTWEPSDGVSPMFFYSTGPTATIAENNAMTRAAAHTPPDFMVLSVLLPPKLVDTICTSNAR